MKHQLLAAKCMMLLIAVIAFQGCKKFNGIDNNSVIKKPYSMYFSDTNGMLMVTNDGELYENVFPPDGAQIRSILFGAKNIIFIKKNLHLSADSGLNFNYKYDQINPQTQVQQMMLDVKSHNRIYVASMALGGISFSVDSGNTWQADIEWDPNLSSQPASINSFTQLLNGALFAISPTDNRLFRKGDANAKWFEVGAVTTLPAGSEFFLCHIKNTLIAADYSGVNGVYYSNDEGKNWYAYTGLNGMMIRSCQAPFDRSLMVGTANNGVFILQGSAFVPSNNGLKQGASVNGIVGKYNLYKNDADIRTIYIATTNGLYRSDDAGKNWLLAKPGVMRSVY